MINVNKCKTQQSVKQWHRSVTAMDFPCPTCDLSGDIPLSEESPSFCRPLPDILNVFGSSLISGFSEKDEQQTKLGSTKHPAREELQQDTKPAVTGSEEGCLTHHSELGLPWLFPMSSRLGYPRALAGIREAEVCSSESRWPCRCGKHRQMGTSGQGHPGATPAATSPQATWSLCMGLWKDLGTTGPS